MLRVQRFHNMPKSNTSTPPPTQAQLQDAIVAIKDMLRKYPQSDYHHGIADVRAYSSINRQYGLIRNRSNYAFASC